MAKRKKGSKKRRRVSGIGAMLNPNSPIVKIAAIAGGYFLGTTINPFLDTLIPDSLTTATAATATTAAKAATLTPDQADQILMAGEGGLGLLLMFKGKKSVVKNLAGGVLIGAGLQRALVSFGVVKGIGGYQNVPVIGRRRMAGYQQTPVLGKLPAQLQGTFGKTPAQLQGYRVNGPGYVPNGSGSGNNVMGSLYTTAMNTDTGSGSGIQNSGSMYMN